MNIVKVFSTVSFIKHIIFLPLIIFFTLHHHDIEEMQEAYNIIFRMSTLLP